MREPLTREAALALLAQAEASHRRADWKVAARALGALVAAEDGRRAHPEPPAPVAAAAEALTALGVPEISASKIPAPADPPRLLPFLAERGLADPGGELASRDLDRWHRGRPFRRRIVREGGIGLELAAHAAFDAGFFPDLTWEQFEPDAAERLIAAMEREYARDFPALGGGEPLWPEAYDIDLEGPDGAWGKVA